MDKSDPLAGVTPKHHQYGNASQGIKVGIAAAF
jgi:hypothetical protein